MRNAMRDAAIAIATPIATAATHGRGDAWCGKKGAILQRHLTILQQIIQQRQHVALSLLNALEEEHASVDCRAQRWRVGVPDGAVGQLTTLL